MKLIYLLGVMMMCACNENVQNGTRIEADSTRATGITPKEIIKKDPDSAASIKKYSNTRFREVAVERSGPFQFTISGKGQIFEASFGWVVEDGHDEIKKGFQMTDAGAPEWGNFRFTIDVKKKRPNSTLTLVLFETSAKDGSRQYELPIVLY